MNRTISRGRPRRRGGATARVVSLAVAAAGLAAVGATTAAPAQAAGSFVDDATFTWGLSGYAQQGVFGPWTLKDLTGNATQLVGSVSGGSQSEYVVEPVPATSMPSSTPQKTPNAVRFTGGHGNADPATHEVSLSWTGSYTVNAYPAQFNAPNEIYSDPRLTLDDEGDGALTMGFTVGAGVDMSGNPTPAQDLGRVTLLEFDAGDVVSTGADSFRATPAYQGVEVEVPSGETAQNRSCTDAGGATGWWGSWPATFVNTVPGSVRPHFYSTGCGGMNDTKAPLPIDVRIGEAATATVAVSDDTLLPSGTQEVTVTGVGFDPSAAIGTRPPFAGKQSGVYVAFGRYLDVWRPSAGAPSSARKNPAAPNGNGVAVKWAVPSASFPGSPAQDPSAPTYTTLGPNGRFSTTLKVDRSWLASEPGNFGIYTYAGGGPNVAAYETYTPITFAKATPTVTVDAPAVGFGEPASATITVASEGGTSGSVTLSDGDAEVGTQDLVEGTATFDLGSDLAFGPHELTATFSGNDNTASGTGSATLLVGEKTTPIIEVLAPTTTYGAPASVTVALDTQGGPAATGAVTLRMGETVLEPQDLVAGTTTFDLGTELPAGAHQLLATYPGDARYTAASGGSTVTVDQASSTASISVPSRTYGQASTATVSVSAPDPSGAVTLKRGSAVVGTSELVAGKATFALGKLRAGRYPLTASYEGNGNVAGTTVTATAVVAKAASRATVTLAKKPAPQRAGKVKVTIATTPARVASGKVKVVLRNAKGRVVKQVTPTLNAAGVATATLPRLVKGRYTLVVTYAGNADVKATSKRLPFPV